MNKKSIIQPMLIWMVFFNTILFSLPQTIGTETEEVQEHGNFESFKSTVSLNFNDADLVDALRMIAVQNNLNVIVGGDVEGTITVSLTDVNLGTAFDAILKVNGYDWFTQGNIVVIKPSSQSIKGELTTRIFKLEYVDASAVADALQNVLSDKGKVQVFSPVMKGGLINALGAGQGGSLGGSPQQNNQLGGTRTGSQSNQSIQTMDHLLVTDYYSNFDEIEKVINTLDQQVPQVNISVKFVETKLTTDERMGIDWTMRTTLNAPSFGGSGEDNILNIGNWEAMRIATLTMPVFSALLEMLSSDGNTKLLQEPQVTVKDNIMADLTVGTKIPILVPQGEGGLVGTQPYRFQDEEININLNVLPRINEGKYISMDVQAVVNALVGYTAEGERPIVSKRSTSTSVMVKNGETLLMGGLIFDQLIETKSHMPVLGKIPLIKKFFSHNISSTEQRELLLFITPNIVTSL